jgi:hypothetical protein
MEDVLLQYALVNDAEEMALLDDVKVVLKGYWIRRASASARTLCPFPEYSPLFQILYLSYPKIRMAIVAYPKVWMTIVWYPDVETSVEFLSEDKE